MRRRYYTTPVRTDSKRRRNLWKTFLLRMQQKKDERPRPSPIIRWRRFRRRQTKQILISFQIKEKYQLSWYFSFNRRVFAFHFLLAAKESGERKLSARRKNGKKLALRELKFPATAEKGCKKFFNARFAQFLTFFHNGEFIVFKIFQHTKFPNTNLRE